MRAAVVIGDEIGDAITEGEVERGHGDTRDDRGGDGTLSVREDDVNDDEHCITMATSSSYEELPELRRTMGCRRGDGDRELGTDPGMLCDLEEEK